MFKALKNEIKAKNETKVTKEEKIVKEIKSSNNNKELFFLGNEINNKIKKTNLKPVFKKYGLLNKDWVEKFKSSLYSKKQNEIIFQYEKISPNFEKKFPELETQLYSLSLPNNFTLVSEELINFISSNFDDENRNKLKGLFFDAIIGGECIIIKDSKNDNIHFITIYNEKNKYNDIDFIFIYFNKEEIDKNLNFIMEKQFLNFLKPTLLI